MNFERDGNNDLAASSGNTSTVNSATTSHNTKRRRCSERHQKWDNSVNTFMDNAVTSVVKTDNNRKNLRKSNSTTAVSGNSGSGGGGSNVKAASNASKRRRILVDCDDDDTNDKGKHNNDKHYHAEIAKNRHHSHHRHSRYDNTTVVPLLTTDDESIPLTQVTMISTRETTASEDMCARNNVNPVTAGAYNTDNGPTATPKSPSAAPLNVSSSRHDAGTTVPAFIPSSVVLSPPSPPLSPAPTLDATENNDSDDDDDMFRDSLLEQSLATTSTAARTIAKRVSSPAMSISSSPLSQIRTSSVEIINENSMEMNEVPVTTITAIANVAATTNVVAVTASNAITTTTIAVTADLEKSKNNQSTVHANDTKDIITVDDDDDDEDEDNNNNNDDNGDDNDNEETSEFTFTQRSTLTHDKTTKRMATTTDTKLVTNIEETSTDQTNYRKNKKNDRIIDVDSIEIESDDESIVATGDDENNILYVVLTSPQARLPHRATSYAIGYDLYSLDETVLLPAHKTTVVNTGVKVLLPRGCYGKIESRSGLCSREGLVTFGGVIDPDYTGELKVVLYNFNDHDVVFSRSRAIAQFTLVRCFADTQLQVLPSDEEYLERHESRYSNNTRLDRGFGSTDQTTDENNNQ